MNEVLTGCQLFTGFFPFICIPNFYTLIISHAKHALHHSVMFNLINIISPFPLVSGFSFWARFVSPLSNQTSCYFLVHCQKYLFCVARTQTERGETCLCVSVWIHLHCYVRNVIICSTAVGAACMQLWGLSFLWDGDDLLPKKDCHQWICYGMYLVFY